MPGLPPLPSGFTLSTGASPPPAPARDPDLLKPLFDLGVEATNGYRTPQDIQRLRSQGYKPVADTLHLNGDAVDLAPGKSGLAMPDIYARANAIASGWPGGKVLNEGDHIHIQLPGWGMAPGTPGTPNSGLPPLPAGAKLIQRGSLQAPQGATVAPSRGASAPTATAPLALTGQAHDGDTVRLSNNQNGRLFGFDAFELPQQGRRPDGSLVPLGSQARDFMLSQVGPGSPAYPTGAQTYGRPVINLSTDPMTDPAHDALRSGFGMAEPNYLRGSPQFGPYMEAERLARLNRLGGFQTNAETPEQFRHGEGPWASATPGVYGQGAEATFFDEPTPFQGLRPEIAKGYQAIFLDPKSTPDDMLAYAKANGFNVDPAVVAKRYSERAAFWKANPSGAPDVSIQYLQPPKPLIDPGDGRFGTTMRGVGDPFNVLDELGGVVDAVGGTSGRENVFNSDRRFGDILGNNIDQNRAILAHDEATHPNYRLGGQIAGSLAIPLAGELTVPRLAAVGAIEGGLAGFGAGEGGIGQRLPGAAIGAGGGAILGPVVGLAAEHLVAPVARRGVAAFNRLTGRGFDSGLAEGAAAAGDVPPPPPPGFTVERPSAPEAPVQAGNGVVQDRNGRFAVDRDPVPVFGITGRRDLYGAFTTSEALSNEAGSGKHLVTRVREETDASGTRTVAHEYLGQDDGWYPLHDLAKLGGEQAFASADQATARARGLAQSAAMAADTGSELVGPLQRRPDVIDVGGLPPLPEGFTLNAPFGVTRQMGERLSPEEMAALAQGVDPRLAVPRPASDVQSLDEAMRASPGRFATVQAPDEFAALPVRSVTTSTGGKVNVRGPLDMTQSLRLMGGVKDDGGDLAHLGIDNAPRRMDFGSNEQFLGKLINNDTGMSLDDAALRLWDEGYFPGFRERPTPADLLDWLHDESTGAQRYFHPDDLAHVQDFNAAQAERGRIGEADAAGSPLVDECGSTINLDDLVANSPPTSAYEDTPRLTGKVGNLNLDKLEKPGDVSALIDQVASRVGGFDAAARGRITNEETQRLAQEIGVKPEQLLKRQDGQALNAEQLYAARALVQRSRETVGRLAQKAIGGSDEDVATFRKAWLRHVALEEQISGATAEAGRALQQFKMLAKAQDAGGEAVRAYLKGAGGKESIEDAANAIVDLMEDPAKANHFMREAVKPRWRDKFNEVWINALLSGPRTHVVNFAGNALTTLMSLPELATTAAIGKVTRSTDRALFGEVAARAAGLADNSVDALRAMKTAFKSGEPLDSIAKVENIHHEAIGGRAGRIIRIPTRALTAADEFWKALLTSGELRQIAYRTARRETKDPQALQARYKALVNSPTDDMLKQAHASARYWTFQKELGPVGQAVQQISNKWVVGKILIPFVRTPSNIIKFAGERSIFGLAMPEVRQALVAGGRARDEALARIALGSGLSTAAVIGALDGRISGGGPSDPGERAALLQSGWQPYSIRIGDKWVSYQRLDPISTLIGMAADFAEIGGWASKHEADRIAVDLSAAVAKNITNKTWLSGLSDAFDVMSDPERYGRNYIQQLTGSIAVPALVNQTAQVTDPHMRDARTLLDGIKARIPLLSQSVPARRNVWGEPIDRGDAVGPDIVSPFYASKISRDPVKQEIARLRAPTSMPQRTVTVAGKRVTLDAQQYSDLVQMSGQAAKRYFDGFMKTPEWRALNDDERRAEVKQTFADFRGSAREELSKRYPSLAEPDDEAIPPPPPGFKIAPRSR